jgi:hypothetical protein
LARAGIKDGRPVLEAVAHEPPANRQHSLRQDIRPTISIELARAATALRFFEGQEDMESCLSIYTVSFPNQGSVAASNERSGLYDEHNNGTAAMTIPDIMDLR